LAHPGPPTVCGPKDRAGVSNGRARVRVRETNGPQQIALGQRVLPVPARGPFAIRWSARLCNFI
jgi:hypothetical protein